MWKFSLYKIIQIHLPFNKRTPRHIARVKAHVSYLQMIVEDLYQFWERTAKDAAMTPQIIYLEWILNTRYGRTDIFISDGFGLGPWIFTHDEIPDPEFFVDQVDSYLWTGNDSITVDFVVNIPAILLSETAMIAATVAKYKLPGKIFVIQPF